MPSLARLAGVLARSLLRRLVLEQVSNDPHPFLARLMPTLAQNASPMSMLRTGLSASSAFDPDGWASWCVLLLPYMEQNQVFVLWDLTQLASTQPQLDAVSALDCCVQSPDRGLEVAPAGAGHVLVFGRSDQRAPPSR